MTEAFPKWNGAAGGGTGASPKNEGVQGGDGGTGALPNPWLLIVAETSTTSLRPTTPSRAAEAAC